MKKWEDNFREYLRKYCNLRNVLPEDAIKHKIVQEVRIGYERRGDVDISTIPNSGWAETGCCK